MSATNFKQGDDKLVVLEITETPAVDFSSATSIIAIFYINETEAKKYSLNTKSGYGPLEVDDSEKNKLNIYVERVDSANFSVGAFTAYILAQFPNVDFPDGTEVKSWGTTVGRVTAGKGLGEEL